METEKTHVTELSFIRAGERGGIERLLVLHLTTVKPLIRSQAQMALKRGLTKWAQTTPAGRKAWELSSEDYNVGDLLGDLGEEDLLGLLKAEGILSIEVAYELESDSISYDHVLMVGVED